MLNILNSPEVMTAVVFGLAGGLAGGLPAGMCILALRVMKIGGIWFK